MSLVFFETKIRPVLVEHCYSCHSSEARMNKKLKGGLLLDTRADLRKGGKTGPGVVPGKPAESLLLKALRHEDDLRMPPKAKLADAVIADFEKWIAIGAPDPRDGRPAIASKPKQHWAWQPLQMVQPPGIDDPWIKTPIDAFVLRDLRAKKLTPSPSAEPRVLLRRLYFDLIGLPPRVNEELLGVDVSSTDKVIDALLASPHHGERWAQHWLDVARYADSAGYSTDTARPTMALYRDFVIRAFNEDLPFDQFVRLQLAGDLMPDGGEQSLATGFCTCGPFNTNSPKEIDRYDELDDILTTTGQAFLGLNLGCARCHDHKYDPVTQTEYYRLLAVFNSSQRTDRVIWTKEQLLQAEVKRLKKIDNLAIPAGDRDLLKKPLDRKNARQLELHNKYRALIEPVRNPVGHVLSERPGAPLGRSVFLERGSIDRKGKPLTSGFVNALMRPDVTEDRWLTQAKNNPRQALADWLVDVERGAGMLTARVIVNRLWQHHFGVGLVATPNDFGVQGEAPSHPDLLDWLAGELIRQQWRMRPIHRLIVRSSAYQQASAFDKAKAASDPDNRLLWRTTPRRLDAEAIRDAILSAGGKLDRTMFGPAVYPVIPKEALLPAAYTAWPNTEKDDPTTWRRSIYVFVKRSTPLPFFQAFDRADRTSSVGKRHRTTIVPQALHLVNDPLIRTQSALFADRVRKEAGANPTAQVQQAYRIALGRAPGEDEEKLLLAFLANGPSRTNPALALTDLCQSILMLNEFIYIE